MYNSNESLINQLSFIHLKEAYMISKKLCKLNNLMELNKISLKYRNLLH